MKKAYIVIFLLLFLAELFLASCSEVEDLIEGEELLPDMSTDDFRDESGVVQWPAEILPEGFIVPAYEEIYSIERKDNVVNITLFAYQDLAKHIWPVIDLKGNLYEAGFMTYCYGNGNYLGQHFYDRVSKTDVIIYEYPYDEILYGLNKESPTDYTYRLEIRKTRLPYESLSWTYPDPETDIGLSTVRFDEWPTDYLPSGFVQPSSNYEFTIKSMVQKGNGLLITVYGSTNDIASYEHELARNFIQIDYLKDSVVYSGSASLNKVYVSKDGDYYYRTLLNYDSGNITDPKDDMCTVQFQICRYNKYIKSQDAVIDESINISTAKPNVSDDVAGELPDDIENPPQRLEVKLKSNGNGDSYYIITGIGSCTDDDLVIPSAIEGVPVSEISSDAFCNNKQIKSVFCGSRVTKIGDRAFLNCTNLKKVTVPDSVIKIGKEAFECCAVSELVLSNRITEIGESAFQLCLNLKSIKLPESLTAISDNTFNGCSNLTTVELSSMTESIGYQAFGGTGISSISIPKSVQTISTGAFNGTKIERFDVDEDNVCFCSIDGCLFSKDKTELLIYPRGRQGEYVVPDGVTQIAENAFFNCNNITLPSSLRSISSAAFVTGSNSLTVNIKTGLEYICEYAFVTPGSGNPVIINFDGTKKEWNSIDKSDKWYHPYFSIGKQRVIVECNDGPLSYSFED